MHNSLRNKKKELLDSANKIVSKVPTTTLVGAIGFEPTAPCSQSKYSTRLSYAPNKRSYTTKPTPCQEKFYFSLVFIRPSNALCFFVIGIIYWLF